MTTNINLVSPEVGNKEKLSGKTTLILSLLLLALAVGAYVVLNNLGRSYDRKEKGLANEIQQEQQKITGPEFQLLADFQQRLVLLDNIIKDRIYFDSYLKNFSKYILPEVRLSSFGWDRGNNKITIKGRAANFDILSKEMMLLRDNPLAQSLDFQTAKEVAGTDSQPGGVEFNMSIVLKKGSL